jgi:hypothetical protein
MKCSSYALVAALVALLPASAGAAGEVATASAAGDAVVWQPQLASYDRLVLIVSGPGGTVTRDFRLGQPPSFSLFDAAGDLVADGQYKWELRVVPDLDAATRRALERDRAAGSTATADALRASGALPAVGVQSGAFRIVGGAVVMPGDFDESAAGDGGMSSATAGAMTPVPQQVVLTNADGVIRDSLCVGFDCPDAPTFSDSTILLMENNTRIKFGDTSVSPFPLTDWEIEANSASSGGVNYLGFNDCGTADNDGGCATDLLFAVEAGARQNALYVESDGDVGVGTANPVLDLHIVTSNTPSIRLDQDASGGFTAQAWDVAGNEASFFVRDVTGGSLLPFRIRPGAPSSSIDISADGDVGIGTASPAAGAQVHIRQTDGSAKLLVEEASGTLDNNRVLVEVVNNGRAQFRLRNTADATGLSWFVSHESNGNFGISREGTGVLEVTVTPTGNMIITGNYTPDYVFEPDYELMPLPELAEFVARERHLPNVPNAAEIAAHGINVNDFPMQLLEKIEELALYTIDQHEQITEQRASISALSEQNARLQERLAALERQVGGSPATARE